MKSTILRYKTIVITGASSGAGKATALEFAKQGCQLVLAARNQQALEATAVECEAFGVSAIAVVTDTGNPADVKRLAKRAKDWRGEIYAWINNAGVLAAGAFDETPIEVSTKVITTNLIGYMNCAHAVLPIFKLQGSGVLINNISIGGFYPVPYGAGYSASKFGLRGFSEALREELSEWKQIHVCDMFSGFLSTPGIQHAANFTGKKLHPGPLLTKPETLAKHIVATAIAPQSRVFVGVTPRMLKIGHALMPAVTSKITGTVMRSYFHSAPGRATSSGNVLQTVHDHMEMNANFAVEKQAGTSGLIKAAGVLGSLVLGFFVAQYFTARQRV